MKTNHRVMYLRNSKKQIIGCLAMKLSPKNHRVEYQISVLNPLDQFDRELSRCLALGRMVENPFTVRLPKDYSTHTISTLVMQSLLTQHNIPTRARKAAKVWLQGNTQVPPQPPLPIHGTVPTKSVVAAIDFSDSKTFTGDLTNHNKHFHGEF